MTKLDLNDFAWFVHVVEEEDSQRQAVRLMSPNPNSVGVLRNWRRDWGAFDSANNPAV